MRHGISHGVGLVVGLFRSTNPIKEATPPSPPPQLLKHNYDITMIEKVVECPWPMVGIYDGINK